MEVKINREIRNYSERIFFGLTRRQLIFTSLSIVSALVVYFLLKENTNAEVISWACMLSASPFIILGFVRYNGMSAEKALITIIKNKFLEGGKIRFACDTLYGGSNDRKKQIK